MTELPEAFPGASEMLNLITAPVREVIQLEHTVLARALSRILDGIWDQPVAGFSNRA
jgi:hypothetical protein